MVKKPAQALLVTMPDGSRWRVPADIIARDRAKYYAEHADTSMQEEYRSAMRNGNELIDWAESNMDWKDVEKHASMVRLPAVDYQEGWMNGEKTVI